MQGTLYRLKGCLEEITGIVGEDGFRHVCQEFLAHATTKVEVAAEATAQAEWQEYVHHASLVVGDALANMTCESGDWYHKGSAIADAIQALEELSRQRDDLDIAGEYPLPRFGLTQGGKKC